MEFHPGNLLDLPDNFLSELKDVDLIICRNVFIFFNKEAISQALATFARLLRVGGYLMTGHGELHGHGLGLKAHETRGYSFSPRDGLGSFYRGHKYHDTSFMFIIYLLII